MLPVHHVVGPREIAARCDDGECCLTLAGFLERHLNGTALCGLPVFVGGLLSFEHGDALDVVGFDVADICDVLSVYHIVGLREIVARGDDGDPALLLAVGRGGDGSGLPWHGVRRLGACHHGHHGHGERGQRHVAAPLSVVATSLHHGVVFLGLLLLLHRDLDDTVLAVLSILVCGGLALVDVDGLYVIGLDVADVGDMLPVHHHVGFR